MSGFSRIAIAAALVTGLGSVAQAQSRWDHPAAASYDVLAEGRTVYVDRAARQSAPVPPSVSDTVMGLSVPR